MLHLVEGDVKMEHVAILGRDARLSNCTLGCFVFTMINDFLTNSSLLIIATDEMI